MTAVHHLNRIQLWLQSTGYAGLVVPSTDAYLSEFAPPAERRLQWATGFQGSTGMAVVLRDRVSLFLDGRYLVQATEDLSGQPIEVLPASVDARDGWLRGALSPGARLALDPWLHSAAEASQWYAAAAQVGFELEFLADNPIDRLWTTDRPPVHRPFIVDYPLRYAGEDYLDKCAAVAAHLRDSGSGALLLADPEDVSWLLNVRAADEAIKTAVGEWHIVPVCPSRALLTREGRVTWFVERDCLSRELPERRPHVEILSPSLLSQRLQLCIGQGAVAFDPRRTPVALSSMVVEAGKPLPDDTVARRRWRKHEVEVMAARRAHVIDSVAVVRFMAWLKRTVAERRVDEFEAAQRLAAFRGEHPDYRGPSMPLMSASGPSGAQPHYVPKRVASRYINDHPIYWMDSGGQYPGGSTDNTVTLAVGEPEAKHVRAHTLVLQGYIALATARVPKGTNALRLDSLARQALWREGMDFAHGTGHGVGNYLNIHEGPLITREPGPLSSVPLEVGMIVTNEPGYYAEGDFGLRIESHMVVVPARFPEFLEFETISRLPIDPKLIDFGRLSNAERKWLADYHNKVLADLEPLLDTATGSWLREIVDAFHKAASTSAGHDGSPLEAV